MATKDSTNIGLYKSNEKTEIMSVQQYLLKVTYAFINVEKIFTKIVKMAKQYWGDVATKLNVMWVITRDWIGRNRLVLINLQAAGITTLVVLPWFEHH